MLQSSAQSDFIGIFEVVANRDASCDGGYFDAEGLQLFVEVEIGGVALHSGGKRQDDLINWSGIALLDASQQRFDVQVADADAVDRGDDATQNVIDAVVLLRVLDSHHLLYVLYYADNVMLAFGTAAYGTNLCVAHAMANPTMVQILFQPHQ